MKKKILTLILLCILPVLLFTSCLDDVSTEDTSASPSETVLEELDATEESTECEEETTTEHSHDYIAEYTTEFIYTTERTTSSTTRASVTVPPADERGDNLVWVPTKGGTKYHCRSSCSNMVDPRQVSIETAKANGYTPCKKCYK